MLDIYIVDDDEQDLILLQRLIEQCKILNPVQIFQGGDEFLNFLETQESAPQAHPALILIDMIMAPLSGLEILSRWKFTRLAQWSNVVMMSGLRDLKAIHDGYQLGAKTFLIKPVTKDDLLQTLAGLRFQIRVAEAPNGYCLHWMRYGSQATEDPDKSGHQPRIISFNL
jgi:FixJ family two-component response regulator